MIITQTPLRISLLGGGTDFPEFFVEHGGAVLTSAIDKYIYCIVTKRFDDKIYVNYSDKEIVSSVGRIKHELVREAMKKVGVKKGVEISFLADIPSSGSGLGSSSSVTVGVLNALYLYAGETRDIHTLASEACSIELDNLKKPMGVQDQYIAAYGGINFIEFTSQGIKINKLALSEEQIEDFDSHLMVFYTGISRSSKSVLTEQKRAINKKTKLLLQMTEFAREGKKLLENEKYLKLGRLMDKSWRIKKRFASKVSNSKIDKMYNSALKAGAAGGKISGAGNGGFLTLIVSPGKRKKVRVALNNYREMPVSFSADGSKSIFNIRN